MNVSNAADSVVVDVSGDLFIVDTNNSRIREVSPGGIITTVAGSGCCGYGGDGQQATAASLNQPQGVAVDSSGNIYIADTGNNVVRKVSTSGIITTVAGRFGQVGFFGDGGPAVASLLYALTGVAVDAAGNLFIADTVNNVIRKVTASSGNISTVAGTTTQGFAGDGAAATLAELYLPTGVFVDAAGNIFIADRGNNRIRKVSTSGTITTVAGSGSGVSSGDGGAATSAGLPSPTKYRARCVRGHFCRGPAEQSNPGGVGRRHHNNSGRRRCCGFLRRRRGANECVVKSPCRRRGGCLRGYFHRRHR